MREEVKQLLSLKQEPQKTYGYRVLKDDYEIKDSDFIKENGVKKSASKELTFKDFDKCLHNVTNKPIAIKQISFRNYNYQICTVASNKTAICNPNKNDKECQDND